MSEEITNEEVLENLKLEAESLGIKVTASATIKSLSEKINEYREKSTTGAPKPVNTEEAAKTKAQNKKAREATKLRRVRITCNDKKINSRGSVLRSVSNSKASITKMIPFDVPTHVPQLILNRMKEERFLSFGRKRMAGGVEVAEPKEVPTFVIEYLDPLTPEEFKRIQIRQQAERAIDG